MHQNQKAATTSATDDPFDRWLSPPLKVTVICVALCRKRERENRMMSIKKIEVTTIQPTV